MRKRIVKSVLEEAGKGNSFRDKAQKYGAGRNTRRIRIRESLHAAAMITGGERSWISAAVSLSMTLIGPPQLGQNQRSLGAAVEACCSTCGAASSSWKQSGKVAARLRLARKPKLRMRTKPLGSRCNRKRRKNSSTGRGSSFCSLWWAESRQRNETVPSANETRRWLEIATRWV